MRLVWRLFVVLTVLGVLSVQPRPVFAHERREVGKYTFVVGFLNEPVFADMLNGIDLTITNTETKQPVEGVEKTLQAEVTAAGKTMPVRLRARFNQPGKYVGDFIPTQPGQYRFHFFGTVEGQAVDERFESGPGRFDDVESSSALQFPEKAPSAVELGRQVSAADATINQARLFGLGGMVLGALGVAVGIAALVTRPRGQRPVGQAVAPPVETND